MKVILLHDHINPTQVVPVDGDSIQAVVPFGSGSSIQIASGGVVSVHETPLEVEKLREN